jgi:hypothetical protein
MAMRGPKNEIGPAFNWFRAALDRQTPPSMLMPPTILMPMHARLADFHLARGNAQEAVDILIEAQERHANDLEILTRLQQALTMAGHPGQVELIGKEIEKVKSE